MTEQAKEVAPIFETRDQERAFGASLMAHGVRAFTVSFSGCGDSGQLDEILFYKTPFSTDGFVAPRPQDRIKWAAIKDVLLPTPPALLTRRHPPALEQDTLAAIAEGLFWYVDDQRNPHDWCNSEGGSGALSVSVREDGSLDIDLDVSENEMVTKDFSYSLSWPLPDDDANDLEEGE